MPLQQGSSQATISANISELVKAGHPQDQAAAIAYRTAGKARARDAAHPLEGATANGAGILFVAPDGDVLLLHRSADEKNFARHWALPGGKAEDGETAEQAADRESEEETGTKANGSKKLLDRRLSPNGFDFRTFTVPVDEKFSPKLNGEHDGYVWTSLRDRPGPIHPSVDATIRDNIGCGADMAPEEWDALRTAFVKWTREEEQESEHAMDSPRHQQALADIHEKMRAAKQKGDDAEYRRLADYYEYMLRKGGDCQIGAQDERLALDRASIRTYDVDDHLRIALTPISKANVCEYYGHEIPKAEALGLEPNRKYALLRDPDELKKAADTSNGKPLEIVHVAGNADDHPRDKVVGAVGTDAVYRHPYLMNSLTIWDREGIDGIEDNSQRELSSAYHYDADMTPGTYMGVPYDGVMRNISFNHVALVSEGRAGSDVIVGDSKEKDMPKAAPVVLSRKGVATLGALVGYLKPRLAQDAAFPNFYDVMKGLTAKNFKETRPAIVTAVKKAKLAKDAKLDDLEQLLDMIESEEVTEGADSNPNSGLPMNADEMEEEKKKKAEDAKAAKDAAGKEFLKGKLSAEDMKAYDDLMGEVEGEDAETKAATENEEGKEGKDEEPKVTKRAMDAAIASAVTAAERNATQKALKIAGEISAAREFVTPWVGRLALDSATSADDIFKGALDVLKVPTKDVHPSAFKTILEVCPKPNARTERLAADAAAVTGEAGTGTRSRFGDSLDRIH